MLAIQHCTPCGMVLLELSVSNGLEEAEITMSEPKNREFLDNLVVSSCSVVRIHLLL
jgi:hypothetical protein